MAKKEFFIPQIQDEKEEMLLKKKVSKHKNLNINQMALFLHYMVRM